MQTKLTFCGGAGSVTGSNFLLESEGARLLIDCGLFQGCDFCEEENWREFPFDPASIQTLLVTHAHIDHIGRIPKLIRDGFTGVIISTEATKALAQPLLVDSMELLKHDAQKHGRAVLYDQHDVERAMSKWRGVQYHEQLKLGGDFGVEFLNAGHILGSAMIKLVRQGRSMIFTGDLGGSSLLLDSRDSIEGANYLLMESVYGKETRAEDPKRRRDELVRVIQDTHSRAGTLLIPAFSTERTQELLFELRMLFAENRVDRVPVYLDSPLAQAITRAFGREAAFFKKEIRERVEAGENIFAFPELSFVESHHQSVEMIKQSGPKIIIAASGMSQGGRVLMHEQEILPDPHSTLLIVGYQAAGSLGRRLMEGARTVTIGSKPIEVRCRIETNFGYSAHLDSPHLQEVAAEALGTLEKIFVVMGEPDSSGFLVQRLRDYGGLDASAPEVGESVTLTL